MAPEKVKEKFIFTCRRCLSVTTDRDKRSSSTWNNNKSIRGNSNTPNPRKVNAEQHVLPTRGERSEGGEKGRRRRGVWRQEGGRDESVPAQIFAFCICTVRSIVQPETNIQKLWWGGFTDFYENRETEVDRGSTVLEVRGHRDTVVTPRTV